jgi:hypothetical protein
VLFKTKEISKESDERENAKESFAKVHEDKKMKNPIWGEMIQRNVKIVKEAMQKRRSRKAQTNTNERKEQNNLPRIEIRYLMFAGRPPISEVLLLDQALIGHLMQLLLLGTRSRLGSGSGSHGDELSILDHRESFLLVLFRSLLLVACCPRTASSAHVPAMLP